jgi:DNA-binding transcriptional ArsR family regulator
MTSENQCCGGLFGAFSPELFRALSEPNRISILCSLAEGEDGQTVSQIAQCCSVDLSVVSRHLRILKDAGVLESTRRGRNVHYRVQIDSLIGALRQLADSLEACCGTKSSCCSPGEPE